MKKTLTFLFWLIPFILSAGNIPLDKAKNIADMFFKNNHPLHTSANLQMTYGDNTTASRSGKAPALYVFDNPNGKGFVIVSADDIASPILGYSFDYDFPEGHLPPNIEEWLLSLEKQINDGRQLNMAPMPQSRTEKNDNKVIIKIETALWDQTAPYNNLCPTLNGKPTVTGCTATAAAIIMRYHQWPEKGTGTLPGYQTSTNNLNIPSNILGHSYEWDKMPLSYEFGKYTQEEANQVAQLMKDVSIMIQSDFGTSTGASSADVAMSLPLYMGYDKSAIDVDRFNYQDETWHRMIQNELNNNRPVLYSGFNSKEGHAFVLDGYTSDQYYSVNWGWGGYCNGYFLLNALRPSGSGTGGNNDHYNFHQRAIFGLKKDANGDYSEMFGFSMDGGGIIGFYPLNEPVESGMEFPLKVSWIGNLGYQPFTGFAKFVVTDKKGNIKENLWELKIEDLPSFYGYNIDATAKVTVPIEIGYRIRLFYKSEKAEEWTMMEGSEECQWELLIADEFTIEESTGISFNKKSRMMTITTKENVEILFLNEEGINQTDICTPIKDGSGMNIDASQLPTGKYILKLTKGAELKEMEIDL